MEIFLQELILTNFKCYRHKEFTFSSGTTTIRGRHGLGKTTTGDAILWCLFGKNLLGQTSFSVKTKDADGREIPHLDHSVETRWKVCRDGAVETLTLRRTLKEVWVKKRGTSEQALKNNTTEFLINGDSVTAKDYDKFISSLISEDVFRAITDPLYFTSLKWQQQREFLSRMVGDVSPDDISGTDEQLRQLASQLSPDKDIIALRKHLSYQIKKLTEKLDKIPVRLEEQNKALPESRDWPAIAAEAASLGDQLAKVEADIIAVRTGNAAEVEQQRIRAELKEVQRQLDTMEQAERMRLMELQTNQVSLISQHGRRFNDLLGTQRDIETSIQSFDTLISRCRQNADDHFRTEQQYIRNQWPQTQADFHQSDAASCPVCNRLLPPDMLADAEASFNRRKAELRQQLTERAAAAKAMVAEAEKQVEDYKRQKAEAEKKLAETKQAINDTFRQKAELEKQTIPTLEESLTANTDYSALLARRSELQAALQSAGMSQSDTDTLANLEADRSRLSGALSQLNAQLAEKPQYDRIQQLIAGILEEQQLLQQQLSELELQEDVAKRYQQTSNKILEERINRHFSLVRWRLFRTVNNGGEPFDEPYCECYVDGIAYHDGLNQAARLNAGLDIIRTLCRHYSVTAPIVIDNSESNLSILDTESQQIRLQVFDSELQVI